MDDKHVHEWVFDRMPMEIRCLTCPDAKMSLEEGERRLNATERILGSAKHGTVEAGIEVMKYVTGEMGWALEGEDEE